MTGHRLVWWLLGALFGFGLALMLTAPEAPSTEA